jgi:hypothetical protein
MIRFALYGQATWSAAGWTLLAFAVFLAAALLGYDPARGLVRRSAGNCPVGPASAAAAAVRYSGSWCGCS